MEIVTVDGLPAAGQQYPGGPLLGLQSAITMERIDNKTRQIILSKIISILKLCPLSSISSYVFP